VSVWKLTLPGTSEDKRAAESSFDIAPELSSVPFSDPKAKEADALPAVDPV
jgi:hypothetical protein